jgi:hypothetical protein
MSSSEGPEGLELVVADDGSIPAEQLRRLGLRPGAHLRVVEGASTQRSIRVGGSIPEFPDLSWEDFEAGSALACHDASAWS